MSCNTLRCATVCGSEAFRLGVLCETFPVLHHPAEAESSCAQRRSRIPDERCREGEHNGFLSCIAQAGFACEGAPAEDGPLVDPMLVVEAVAQREQGAVECVGVEIEQTNLFGQCPSFDQPTRAYFSFDILEPGGFFGEPGFMLLMHAEALGQRTGMYSPKF